MAKILIVDDAAFMRMSIQQMLENTEHTVVGQAMDGEDAVEKFSALKPDVVLLDITMPKMDGITALEQIMTFDKNARVVMVSALGKEELVKKSLLLGAKNYIVKPLDRKKVLERIGTAVK
mgnify:CR=1 FL=1